MTVITAGTFGLSACGPKTVSDADINASAAGNEPATADTSSDETAMSAEGVQIADGGWLTRSETDPMTDAGVLVAFGRATGRAHDIEVMVRCTPSDGGEISYTISGYGKDAKGAGFQTGYADGHTYNLIEYRLDSSGPQFSRTVNPRYGNQAEIAATNIEGRDSLPVAQAGIVTLQVAFRDGDEVYRIDQSSQSFRDVVKPCTTARLQGSRAANSRLFPVDTMADAAPMPPLAADERTNDARSDVAEAPAPNDNLQ